MLPLVGCAAQAGPLLKDYPEGVACTSAGGRTKFIVSQTIDNRTGSDVQIKKLSAAEISNATVVDTLSGPEQSTLIVGGYPGNKGLAGFKKFTPFTIKKGSAATFVLVASLQHLDQDASIDGIDFDYDIAGNNYSDQTKLKYSFQQKVCQR